MALSVAPPAAPPTLGVSKSGQSVTITWADPDSVGFTLQTSSTLLSGSWTTVPGVVNNSVTITVGTTGQAFYRLTK